MVVVMQQEASLHQVSAVLRMVEAEGLTPRISNSSGRTSIGVINATPELRPELFAALPGVEEVTGLKRPFKLASREFCPQDTLVHVRHVVIGAERVCLMAGPCSVETEEQTQAAAEAVLAGGAQILRGGAYKPRSSPYSFQGLAVKGLEILARVRERTGLPVVTEIIAPELVPLVADYADMLQIGARNMQNFALLEAVGQCNKPVLLKRGLMASIEELLMSAEYLLANGNSQVVLCERGIRTFETYTRNTLDINAVPLLKQLTHLPVIVDPSHATGKRDLVAATSRAAIAAGADGLIVEVHHDPDHAWSDGAQSLAPQQFQAMIPGLKRIAEAVDRTL